MSPEPIPSQATESLITRLAGPSTGKAGLAKDQTEINRVIAEASKGSKFYDNEKKKDRDLTERIERILQLRDASLHGVDLKSIEHSADRLISELESQRDLSQTIVHVDMDAFYANVELLDNPDLSGKPFGVGFGVLCTASYEARKYGVRSGMPGFIAKKLCPELIFVPLHFARYMDMSSAVMSVFRCYDPNLFAAGCDEAYLNITAYCQRYNMNASECVQQMRKAVFEETRLTASAGIAPTKMLAKICSDKNKPNGQFELCFNAESIISFLRDLSIRKVPGVGRVNERLLESIGIKTCGDIFTHRATVYLMDKQFGSHYLFRTYLGVTSNLVQPMARGERKSIGAERTFSPLSDKGKILDKLNEIAIELEKDMTENGWTGRTVTLKFKHDTYQVFTRAKSFDRWITKKEDLYATGKDLLLPEFPLTIRLIGLRVTKLKDLRAPPESVNGIKRFFGTLQDSRPQKKLKAEHGRLDNENNAGSLDAHEFFSAVSEDAMPGYHEMNEDDDMLHEDIEDLPVTEIINAHNTFKPRPPNSAPARMSGLRTKTQTMDHSAASSASGSRQRTTKPLSSVNAAELKFPEKVANLTDEICTCPVCGKTLQTDNQGLNSHIDFCLSRDAIRQAHAEATASPVKGSFFKPISKAKGGG